MITITRLDLVNFDSDPTMYCADVIGRISEVIDMSSGQLLTQMDGV